MFTIHNNYYFYNLQKNTTMLFSTFFQNQKLKLLFNFFTFFFKLCMYKSIHIRLIKYVFDLNYKTSILTIQLSSFFLLKYFCSFQYDSILIIIFIKWNKKILNKNLTPKQCSVGKISIKHNLDQLITIIINHE